MAGGDLSVFAAGESTPIAPRSPSLLDAPQRRPRSAKSVEQSKKMLYAVAAVSALMVIPMFAAIYLSGGGGADRPVEDLSFKRMGADLDSFLGEVEHETDFRNLLDGKTYAEQDLTRMIHGSKTAGAAFGDKKMSTHTHADKHSTPDKASRGSLSAHSSASTESETPLAAHWVQAPPQEAPQAQPKRAENVHEQLRTEAPQARPKRAENVQEQLRTEAPQARPTSAEHAQQQLRALGGPEIVYEASKALRGRVNMSPAALRAHRARDMRTEEGASRELGHYFSHAHSAATTHPKAPPFARDRLWTVGTEKADMNNYFDHLQQRTEGHLQEIRNLHRAVEPSTAWQDGAESHQDLLMSSSKDAAEDVMKQAGTLLTLTRQDLKGWRGRHSDLTSAGDPTLAT